MADIQHASIPDANLHEVKGAATALNNTWLKANGNGTASFTALPVDAPYTFVVQDFIADQSDATQYLSNINDEIPVVLSGNAITSPGGAISVAADGEVTFNFAGVYHVSANGTVGRTSNSGETELAFSARINGAQSGGTTIVSLDNAASTFAAPVNTSGIIQATAGDKLRYHMARLTNGAGDAGLKPVTVGLANWNNAASARVSIYKLGVTQ